MTSNLNLRIARNSLYMAFRMVLVLLISLYTTRVTLRILGVQDYGIYNVVCGFVTMFGFLNTSMSNAIQRYFNFELGKNDTDKAENVFNTSLIIQGLLAIIIVVLAESIGPWYINNKVVLSEDRIIAAHWIFQCSVVSFTLIILRAPFTAAIVAHERMDFTALISVLDAILKLCILYLIPIFNSDKLILYGILMTLTEVINSILNYLYAKDKFIEIRLSGLFDRQMFRSMLNFASWNIFGSFAGVMKEQGINIILNLFFGPVVNAARGVANQINSGLQSFVSNLTIPVRPQVIQSYASGDINRTMRLTFSISKLSCCFLFICALPVILEIDYILRIWLGDRIPDHTNSFVIIVIMISFINNLNSAVSGVVHASGKMRNYQIITSLISLLCIPSSYFALKHGAAPEYALLSVFFAVTISQIAALLILKTIVNYKLSDYFNKVIRPFLLFAVFSSILPLCFRIFFNGGILRFLIVIISSFLACGISLYLIALNNSEKEVIKTILNGFIIRFKQLK